jgi:pimeloyl-ACP methyl ester carboxylesterase
MGICQAHRKTGVTTWPGEARGRRLSRHAATVGCVYSVFTPSHRGGSGSPLVCLHGFTDTWRTWDLILPRLERDHDVFAPTLPGHAGGPPLRGEITDALIPDAIERAMDEAGIETAQIVGNSLGGYVALQLAERGRADSVVALAPAGGWAREDRSRAQTLNLQATMHHQLRAAGPYAETIVASAAGRRRVTQLITTNFAHIPPELLAHQIRGAASCDALPFIEFARRAEWHLNAEKITCPVRIAWGTNDRLLPWPSAATRFRNDWLPHAEWIELDGIGHCPQLDIPVETAQLILGCTTGRPRRAAARSVPSPRPATIAGPGSRRRR